MSSSVSPPLPAQFRNSWIGPNWMQRFWNRRFMFSLLKPLDQLVEVMLQGIAAACPGLGTPTANPYIGRARGLVQGESESSAKFGARARNWITTWNNAGSDEVLVSEIQAYLGNTPTVRVVNRAGFFVSIDPSGNITYATDTNWNWDSISNPERQGLWQTTKWWSDIWIIVYPAEWGTYVNFADPNWTNAIANGWGMGHMVARTAYDAILGLVRLRKGPHTFVQSIIFSTDPALFVPGSLGTAGNPDGRWGAWSKNVNGTQVPSRTSVTAGGTVRYWDPNGG